MFLVLSIVGVVFAFLILAQQQVAAKARVDSSLQDAAREGASRLDNLVDKSWARTRALSTSNEVRRFLAVSSSDRVAIKPALRPLVDLVVAGEAVGIDQVELLDRTGRIVFSTTDTDETDASGQPRYANKPQFTQVTVGREYNTNLQFVSQQNRGYLYFSVPVPAPANTNGPGAGEFVGVVVLRLNSTALMQQIAGSGASNPSATARQSSIVWDLSTRTPIRLLSTSHPAQTFQAAAPVDKELEQRLIDNGTFGDLTRIDYTNTPDLANSLKNLSGNTVNFEARDESSKANDYGAIRLRTMPWVYTVQQESASVIPSFGDTLLLIGPFVVLFAILFAALSYLIARRTFRPLRQLAQVANEVRLGNLAARVPNPGKDEFGEVGAAFNAMLEDITSLIQTRDERDQLQREIIKLLDEVAGVADGDLTIEAEVTASQLGALADAFNYMVAELRQITMRVNDATNQVTASTYRILYNSDELSTTVETQAERIQAASNVVAGLVNTSKHVAARANHCSVVAQAARENAQAGAEAMVKTIRGMAQIRSQVRETSRTIKRLGEVSQEIGQIIEVIDDIADQTTMLAMNAALAAAQAGEHGRGFAIVAEQVGKLAERSAEATREVATLVRNIQMETNAAVVAMETGTRDVVEGSRLADIAGERLSAIDSVVAELTALITDIADAAQEQAVISDDIAQEMHHISETTRNSTEGTRLTVEAAGHLSRLAEQLGASVAAFRIHPESSVAAGVAAPSGLGHDLNLNGSGLASGREGAALNGNGYDAVGAGRQPV